MQAGFGLSQRSSQRRRRRQSLSPLVTSLVDTFMAVNGDALHAAMIVPGDLVHFQNQLSPLVVLQDGPEMAWTPEDLCIEVARPEYLVPVRRQFAIRDRGTKGERSGIQITTGQGGGDGCRLPPKVDFETAEDGWLRRGCADWIEVERG